MTYKICILLPTYNHFKELRHIASHLFEKNLDILIVDDGSGNETQSTIADIKANYPTVHTLRLPINQGKGVAIAEGFRFLNGLGYTHAFQIDADGQHALEPVDDFIKCSMKNPTAILTGNPIYDASVPKARQIGRWFTHVWVWVETLSFRIRDSMCGYRVYPIKQTLTVLDEMSVGLGMQFDTEVIVRLFWKGVPTIMLPISVSYPACNTSNFDVWRDNWRITKMHTTLVILMLLKLPFILKNRPNYKNIIIDGVSTPWASISEQGTLFGIYTLAFLCRILGRRMCRVIGYPIVLFYCLANKEQRHESLIFLSRIYIQGGLSEKPGFKESFSHFMHFFDMAMDKFVAWTGQKSTINVATKELEKLNLLMQEKRGGMFLVSHLGNIDFCRAISIADKKKRIHVLLHTKNAKRFNHMLKFFNSAALINIIEVSEVGPDTIIRLKEYVDAGDWVAITGDRFLNNSEHISLMTFLGEVAPFPHGPYILASMLECPIYSVFALKEENQFKIYVDLIADKIVLHRNKRTEDIQKYMAYYVQHLEKYTLQFPYQWFNFFAFWDHSRINTLVKEDLNHENN